MICDDCIIEALDGRAAYNPATGRLRLAKGTNRVWLAVEKLGGVKATAKLLGYPKQEIHRWIDEHFIPHGIVEEVARLTLYSILDLQVPLMWVGSDGFYWPPSGYLAERAEETEAYNKRAPKTRQGPYGQQSLQGCRCQGPGSHPEAGADEYSMGDAG